jgi:hypothetical protein
MFQGNVVHSLFFFGALAIAYFARRASLLVLPVDPEKLQATPFPDLLQATPLVVR